MSFVKHMLPISMFCLSSVLVPVYGRHLHRHHGHLHARQALLATLTESAPTPKSWSGEPTKDLSSLEQTLLDIPQDLIDVLLGVIDRIQSIEAALAQLLDASPDSMPTLSVIAPVVLQTELPSLASLLPSLSGALYIASSTVFSDSDEPLTSTAPKLVTHTTVSTTTHYVTVTPTSPDIAEHTDPPELMLTDNHEASEDPPSATATNGTPAAAFNASSPSNIAVYFGSSPTENATLNGLHSVCGDPAITIVNLAFLTAFFGPRAYPSTDFGPGCNIHTKVQAIYAPGLFNCSQLGRQVEICQDMGKKVMISLRASTTSVDSSTGKVIVTTPNSTFYTADSARQFASTLWSLFGAGVDENPELRPFGDTIVDGFDIYPITPNNTAHPENIFNIAPPYDVDFVSALRDSFASDPKKSYYISAAPTSHRPDATIGLDALRLVDFVYIRYYDGSITLQDDDFRSNLAGWVIDMYGENDGTVTTMALEDNILIARATAAPALNTSKVPDHPSNISITISLPNHSPVLSNHVSETSLLASGNAHGYRNGTRPTLHMPIPHPIHSVSSEAPPTRGGEPPYIITPMSSITSSMVPNVALPTSPTYPPAVFTGPRLFISLKISDGTIDAGLANMPGNTTAWSAYRPPHLDLLIGGVAAAGAEDYVGGVMLWGAVEDIERVDSRGLTFAGFASEMINGVVDTG